MIFGGDGNDTTQSGNGPVTIYGGGGNDLIVGGRGRDTIDGGSGHNQIQVGSGPTLIQDGGVAGHDTVVGVDVAHDGITFAGENTATINQVVATANVHGGNTTISLPDGSTMTLVGITHIDHTFLHCRCTSADFGTRSRAVRSDCDQELKRPVRIAFL